MQNNFRLWYPIIAKKWQNGLKIFEMSTKSPKICIFWSIFRIENNGYFRFFGKLIFSIRFSALAVRSSAFNRWHFTWDPYLATLSQKWCSFPVFSRHRQICFSQLLSLLFCLIFRCFFVFRFSFWVWLIFL